MDFPAQRVCCAHSSGVAMSAERRTDTRICDKTSELCSSSVSSTRYSVPIRRHSSATSRFRNTLSSLSLPAAVSSAGCARSPLIVGSVERCAQLPDTDTLHVLIKGYRDQRKILLNIEHRLMLQMAPDYDNMCLMQKIEVFEHALHNTTGQDLYRILWLKSKNSEAWLDRRSNYIRSLAVMSMVGHVLGLGDRHPSNLLLHRSSGMVVYVRFQRYRRTG